MSVKWPLVPKSDVNNMFHLLTYSWVYMLNVLLGVSGTTSISFSMILFDIDVCDNFKVIFNNFTLMSVKWPLVPKSDVKNTFYLLTYTWVYCQRNTVSPFNSGANADLASVLSLMWPQ